MESLDRGFREIEHTADWELEVWAPDLLSLLEQAARGMYVLSGIRHQPGHPIQRSFKISAVDGEDLLVQFLSELLFLSEQERLVFDQFGLTMLGDTLEAKLVGRPILTQDKEIKAVTYHNLEIRQLPNGLSVNLVFDV